MAVKKTTSTRKTTKKKIIINKTEACGLLNVAPPTFTRLIQKGMPYIKKGQRGKKNPDWQLNKEDVLLWYDEHYNKDKTQKTDTNTNQQRKLAAEAAYKEIQVAKMRGELISQDSMMKLVSQDYSNVRSKILVLSSILAPIIYVPELNERKQIIDDVVREILEELSADTVDISELVTNITEEIEEV